MMQLVNVHAFMAAARAIGVSFVSIHSSNSKCVFVPPPPPRPARERGRERYKEGEQER